jgi:hypothetical protein
VISGLTEAQQNLRHCYAHTRAGRRVRRGGSGDPGCRAADHRISNDSALVAHMQMTASWLEDEVSGLSTAQAAFRPSPTSWTIPEVLDHLVVVGPIYWNDLQRAKPVDAAPAG